MVVEKGWGNHRPRWQRGQGGMAGWGLWGIQFCLMGLIVYFLALSPQSLENVHPHIEDFAGVRICVYFGRN